MRLTGDGNRDAVKATGVLLKVGDEAGNCSGGDS